MEECCQGVKLMKKSLWSDSPQQDVSCSQTAAASSCTILAGVKAMIGLAARSSSVRSSENSPGFFESEHPVIIRKTMIIAQWARRCLMIASQRFVDFR